MQQQNPFNNRQKTYLPWIAALAFFMQALDATILNTALPAIAKDLNHSPLEMQAVLISYTITLALLIPVSGWLADKFGTQKIFILSIILFSLGSLCCALSYNLTQLTLSRILQGIGGAMMVPVARLVILYAYPKKLILRVLNFIIIPGLIGPLIGPSLGGLMVDHFSWHWIFLINIPISIITIIISYYAMPNFVKETRKFDFIGFILFSGTLILLTLALEIANETTLNINYITIATLGAILSCYLYIKHAQKSANPLIDLKLFKIRTLKIGLIGSLCSRLGIGGFPFLLPLLLQVGFGFSASIAGLMLIPSAAGNLLTKSLVPVIVKKYGYKNTLLGNTILLAIIIAAFAIPNEHVNIYLLMPILFVFGMLSSIQFTSMNTIAIADLDKETTSEGNSMIAVTQQLSMSFGVSVGSFLLNSFHITSFKSSIMPFKYTFVVLGIITALSALIFIKLKPSDGNNLSGHREEINNH